MFTRRSVALLVALTLSAFALPAAAQAPLLATFGGPEGFGPGIAPAGGVLAPNDDGSTTAISLTTAFPMGLRFFGGPYTTFFVNNNGNITFAGPLGTFTPNPFPVASRPMIAPYWADVDTRGSAPRTANNYVVWHMTPGQLVVTWHNVGYFSRQDDRKMDFQLILRNTLDCGSGDFDVEFRYNVCGWTTGSASGGSGGFGGTPAQAGFDAGDGVNFVEIMNSRTGTIHTTLCTMSNVAMPGVWQFAVRGGAVVCPGAGDPCSVPDAMGVCSLGVTACVGRAVRCVAVSPASAERCDNVDNDCDGVTDGPGLCSGAGEVCVGGRCIAPCFEGGCFDTETCTPEGVCVETACVGVPCAAGTRCVGGTCVGSCDGVTCPRNQDCFAGRCVDMCDVLTCGMDEVCSDGACHPQCPCQRCDDTEICGSDGVCTPVGCDIVICDPGFYCADGSCLDACAGVSCPTGQYCTVGECVDIPPTPDAGPPERLDASTEFDDAGPIIGDIDSGTGGSGEDAGRRGRTPGGCSCRVGGGASQAGLLFGLGIFALAIARRSRRA